MSETIENSAVQEKQNKTKKKQVVVALSLIPREAAAEAGRSL